MPTPRVFLFAAIGLAACGDKAEGDDTAATTDDTGPGVTEGLQFAGSYSGSVQSHRQDKPDGPSDACSGPLTIKVEGAELTAVGTCTWVGDFADAGFADIAVNFEGTLLVEGTTATFEAPLGPDPMTGTVIGQGEGKVLTGTMSGSGSKEGQTVSVEGNFTATKDPTDSGER